MAYPVNSLDLEGFLIDHVLKGCELLDVELSLQKYVTMGMPFKVIILACDSRPQHHASPLCFHAMFTVTNGLPTTD